MVPATENTGNRHLGKHKKEGILSFILVKNIRKTAFVCFPVPFVYLHAIVSLEVGGVSPL